MALASGVAIARRSADIETNIIGMYTLAAAILLWAISLYGMLTPTNRLYAQGLILLPVFSFTIGSVLAFVMVLKSIASRKKSPKTIFVFIQLLCWPLAFEPVAFVIAGFYQMIHYGA